MPIRIRNLHLGGPRKVLWSLENGGTALAVLVVEDFDVFDAEPHPRVSRIFTSWNQMAEWLRRVDGARAAA